MCPIAWPQATGSLVGGWADGFESSSPSCPSSFVVVVVGARGAGLTGPSIELRLQSRAGNHGMVLSWGGQNNGREGSNLDWQVYLGTYSLWECKYLFMDVLPRASNLKLGVRSAQPQTIHPSSEARLSTVRSGALFLAINQASGRILSVYHPAKCGSRGRHPWPPGPAKRLK